MVRDVYRRNGQGCERKNKSGLIQEKRCRNYEEEGNEGFITEQCGTFKDQCGTNTRAIRDV